MDTRPMGERKERGVSGHQACGSARRGASGHQARVTPAAAGPRTTSQLLRLPGPCIIGNRAAAMPACATCHLPDRAGANACPGTPGRKARGPLSLSSCGGTQHNPTKGNRSPSPSFPSTWEGPRRQLRRREGRRCGPGHTAQRCCIQAPLVQALCGS